MAARSGRSTGWCSGCGSLEGGKLEAANGRAEREGGRTAAEEPPPPPERPSPPVREQGMGAAGVGEPDPPASAPDPSGSASGRPEEVQTRGEAQLGGERQGRRGRPEVWSTAAAARGLAVEREEKKERERKGRGEERCG